MGSCARINLTKIQDPQVRAQQIAREAEKLFRSRDRDLTLYHDIGTLLQQY